MIDKNPYQDAVKRATRESTRYMSALMRTEARASGWPEKVVRSITVDDSFNVNVGKDHHSLAMNLEYGTPDTQPTAALRRMGNRTEQVEHFFVRRLSSFAGGVK